MVYVDVQLVWRPLAHNARSMSDKLPTLYNYARRTCSILDSSPYITMLRRRSTDLQLPVRPSSTYLLFAHKLVFVISSSLAALKLTPNRVIEDEVKLFSTIAV